MSGTITTRHVLTQAATIIREFGWVVYGRALLASLHLSNRRTFLSCL
jgi:hypothetical protein